MNICVDSPCLFVPQESINNLELSNFKIESSSVQHDYQQENIDDLAEDSGFEIPLKNISQTYFSSYDDETIDSLKANKNITDGIFKAKHVGIEIGYLDDLLELRNYFPVVILDIVSYSTISIWQLLKETRGKYD